MTQLIILAVVLFYVLQFLVGYLFKSKGTYFVIPAIWLLISIFLIIESASLGVRDLLLVGIGFFVLLAFADRGQRFAQNRKDSNNV